MRNYFLMIVLLVCLSDVNAQLEPIQLVGEAQGTSYHISYTDSLQRDFYRDVDSLLMDFDRSLSTYQNTSLISRINKNERNSPVDSYFETCFRKAKEIWKETDGAFDPTVYPLVNAWGFGPEMNYSIDSLEIDSILTFVGFEMIKLENGRVLKNDPRSALDFNAFAQGYSVDVVAAFFNDKLINNYLIEIGGEVIAKGMRSSTEDWLVGIEKPEIGKSSVNPLEMIIRLDNNAVATSGNYRKFVIENGMKYSHQIDPKTGYPVQNSLLSVTVIAKDCLSADAYATALSVMGLEKAKVFLDSRPDLHALFIYSDEEGKYQVYQTPLFAQFIMEE